MGVIQQIILCLSLLLVSCRPNQSAVITPVEPEAHVTQPVIAPEPSSEPKPDEADMPPIAEVPLGPAIIPAAKALILEFEGFDHKPAWPEAASGVTIGYGYDCGYYARTIIEHDWNELQDTWRTRLGDTAGYTGRRAQALISGLRDINISTVIGTRVFDNVDVPREFDNCKRTFPGFENLRPPAQGALISLGYNRGYGMSGDSRREMRAIRDLVPKQDYSGIANEIRKMKRIWQGTVIQNGMNRRRDAEAKLVETP